MHDIIYKNDLGTDIEETDIPDAYKDKAEEYRQNLLEALAETDEFIMEKYLEGEAISTSELREAIRRATINL